MKKGKNKKKGKKKRKCVRGCSEHEAHVSSESITGFCKFASPLCCCLLNIVR